MPETSGMPEPPNQAPLQVPRWLDSVQLKGLWVGAVVAVGSYLAGFLVAMAMVMISVIGASTSNGGHLVPTGTPGFSGVETGNVWSVLGQLTAQLLAMAHLGKLSTLLEGAVPFLGTIQGGASVYAVPLGLLAISSLSVYTGSRVAEHRVPSGSRAQLVAQSLVTGAVYSAAVNVVAAAAAISFPASNGFSTSPVTAAGFWPTVFSMLLGFAVSAAARSRTAAAEVPPVVPAPLSRALNLPLIAASSHLLLFTCIAAPVVWVFAGVSNGWAGLLTVPLWIGNATGLLFVMAHLGGLRVLADASYIGGAASGNTDRIFYGFDGGVGGGADLALTLGAFLLALICTLLTGLLVLLRRGYADSAKIGTWVPVPAAYLTLGLVLLPLLNLSATFKLGTLVRADYGLGLVWWAPVVFLLWGFLVEATARYLAPYLLPFVPVRLQNLVRTGVPPIPASVVADSLERQPTADQQTTDLPVGDVSPANAARGSAYNGPPLAKRLSPAGRRKALLIAVSSGVVAVLAIGSLGAVTVIKAGNGPDKVVRDYIQALVDGDAERAVRISDPGVPNEQRVLLSNTVYGAATKRIDGYAILSSQVTGKQATVWVEVRQDGRRSEIPFVLDMEHPDILDDHWKLQSRGFNTVRLSADAAVSAFSVNGVGTVAAPRGGYGSAIELPAFPGEYTIGLPAKEKYLAAKEKRILVGMVTSVRTTEDTSLEVTGSNELAAEVDRQVGAALSKCAASKELSPEGCPFYTFGFGETRNVKWAVPVSPKISVRPSYNGTWRISTATAGTAEVSYERNTSFNPSTPDWKQENDSVAVRVYGTATVNSDSVSVELSKY
ncbi:hypothetical protein [Arthrobacter methylotrophus]|uniref:Integral membrane protein n=2 Tax=Arthrobacter methylotrophus TaxID=121291 RepID=A0ABV5UMJ2_9MICC